MSGYSRTACKYVVYEYTVYEGQNIEEFTFTFLMNKAV